MFTFCVQNVIYLQPHTFEVSFATLQHCFINYAQLQTASPDCKFPNEYTDVIFIQIDQYLKQLLPKYKGIPIL